MARRNRKLTPDERRAKAARNAAFEIIFVNGKQKRVRRRTDQSVGLNDPIWLLQNEMWPELHEYELRQEELDASDEDADESIPF